MDLHIKTNHQYEFSYRLYKGMVREVSLYILID